MRPHHIQGQQREPRQAKRLTKEGSVRGTSAKAPPQDNEHNHCHEMGGDKEKKKHFGASSFIEIEKLNPWSDWREKKKKKEEREKRNKNREKKKKKEEGG